MTTEPKDGGPAFPQPHPYQDGNDNWHCAEQPGMSLRTYLIAHAPEMPSNYYMRDRPEEPTDVVPMAVWDEYSHALDAWRISRRVAWACAWADRVMEVGK